MKYNQLSDRELMLEKNKAIALWTISSFDTDCKFEIVKTINAIMVERFMNKYLKEKEK